jgi:hypothetical protein
MPNGVHTLAGQYFGQGIEMAAHDTRVLWARIVALMAAILSVALVMAIIYAV